MKLTTIIRNTCCTLMLIYMGSLLQACSDVDSHYAENSQILGDAHYTIWENLKSNPDLSDFTALVQKAGFDKVLQSSQMFTVWAPVNGSFDSRLLQNETQDKLLTEFVENHIARFNYPASGSEGADISMLNRKVKKFAGDGTYSIGGIDLIKTNVPSSNGVIHTIGGILPFWPNIFESLQAGDLKIDSVCNYYHHYDNRTLDLSQSVEGPMVDGEISYLDSVFKMDNVLWQRYRAFINEEDSNYTMLVPTNQAWEAAKAKIESFYNYVPSFTFLENTALKAADGRIETEVKIDNTYLHDSIVHRNLIQDLFYNNNIYGNKKLTNLQTGKPLQADSLVSTMGNKIYESDAAELFEGTVRVDKSNGAMFVTDCLRMKPWTTWNPVLRIEGESNRAVANTFYGTSAVGRVPIGGQNPDVSGEVSQHAYIEAIPASSASNPEIDFYLPGVRSTTYNIYAVFVPSNITNTYITDPLPNNVQVTLGYNSTKGSLLEKKLGTFNNDASKVDTVMLGEFTFPIAYYGTGNYYPYIRIVSRVTPRQSSIYDRGIRIDCLLLVPKELDEYIKEHPGYKYDQGEYPSYLF